MIDICEVKTKKEIKEFVDFPTKLYKNNPYYVHPLRMDEIAFVKRGLKKQDEDFECVFYLAYLDGEVVGRICGIIQRAYNKKTGENRARFNRFDSINNLEVSSALFITIEKWAKDKGMNIVHGPLGTNDLEREGLLIEGFNEIATFEEQYNYDYYQKLIENAGYVKDTDWLEYKLFAPKVTDEKINRISEAVMKKHQLSYASTKNKNVFLKKYAQKLFDLIDESYGSLYGTVPLSDKSKKELLSQFKLFLDLKWFVAVVDKDDEVVGFGFGFPSLSKAVNKCEGKLFPFGFIKVLKALKKPKVIDLALIGVRNSYKNSGISSIIIKFLSDMFIKEHVDYVETNLNLEDNIIIQNHWKYFEHVNHKRRRSFTKTLN